MPVPGASTAIVDQAGNAVGLDGGGKLPLQVQDALQALLVEARVHTAILAQLTGISDSDVDSLRADLDLTRTGEQS